MKDVTLVVVFLNFHGFEFVNGNKCKQRIKHSSVSPSPSSLTFFIKTKVALAF